MSCVSETKYVDREQAGYAERLALSLLVLSKAEVSKGAKLSIVSM